jgi:hypothetical protein
MLPPVQTSSRSVAAFVDSSTENAHLPNTAGGAGLDTGVRADQNNSSSIAGRINNLLLNSRETVRADMATIANMVGSSIGITRKPGEADGAFAARFVAALTKLDEGQQAALQKQLNQVLKGLQVQVLLQVLQNQDGPEAALLSAYMEIQRSNRDNLKAQTVVSSYNQNSESAAAKSSEPQAANATATAASRPPQTSITVALQGAVSGVVDKEAAIANLAAALRQASAGALTDYKTESGQVISVSPQPNGSDEAKAAARSTTPPAADANASTSAKALSAKIPDLAPSPASNGPSQTATSPENTTASGAAPATPKAPPAAPTDGLSAKQPATQATPTPMPPGALSEPSSAKARVAEPALILPLPPADPETRPRPNGAMASSFEPALKDMGGSARPTGTPAQATAVENGQVHKDAAMAMALSMKGWGDATALASQPLPNARASTEAELLRQMFFQSNEPNESAEASALRALANRPEAAQNADIAKPKTADSREIEAEEQTAEGTPVRTQAVLTLAGAQAMPIPAPSQVIFPLAVPVLIVNYLANQQAPVDERDISIDAIDALGDEETQKDTSQQHPDQDRSEDEEDGVDDNRLEDDPAAMFDNETLKSNGASADDESRTAQAVLPMLSAPQEEPVPADSLYWKIADLE